MSQRSEKTRGLQRAQRKGLKLALTMTIELKSSACRLSAHSVFNDFSIKKDRISQEDRSEKLLFRDK
ncbi:MAG: hypothetical protein D6808_08015 [Candidatus Dadabacteria bacterium]|nr:MAG: hypothetical protein D6808_08015 [Candidatus Dadabacteria bacterium]